MRFCVLGPLEAYADERSVAVGGGRQRALLALLLVHAGEVVSPVRASDLRRGLERLYSLNSQQALYYLALQGAAECTQRPAACDLSHGVITDDRTGTIILRLTHPDPDLLFKLTLPTAWPVPPGTPRTHLAPRPVPSTGPYQVAQFIPGRRLLLVRNKRFREWSRAAQPDGYPDRIDIRMDNNPSHRVQAVQRGDSDLALEIAGVNLAPLRIRFTSQLRLDTQPDTSFLSFNLQRPPFSNALARRAVNLAIDRSAVARGLSGPGLSTPTCQVLPPNFPGYQAYCPWTRAPRGGRWHGPDIARARALVRASGTAGATVDSSALATTPSRPRPPARSSRPCARSATVRE